MQNTQLKIGQKLILCNYFGCCTVTVASIDDRFITISMNGKSYKAYRNTMRSTARGIYSRFWLYTPEQIAKKESSESYQELTKAEREVKRLAC